MAQIATGKARGEAASRGSRWPERGSPFGRTLAPYLVVIFGITSLLTMPVAFAQVQRSFLDLGFEQPVLTAPTPATGCYMQVDDSLLPGWSSAATTPSSTGLASGNCTPPPPLGTTGNLVEMWTTRFLNVVAREGRQFAELNAVFAGRLYQNVCVVQGEQVGWQLSHRGRSGTDVMSFNIDSSANQIMRGSTGTNGVGTVVAGSCGNGLVTGATCNAPTTTTVSDSSSTPTLTSGWADYTGTFTWNGTSGVHNFGFQAISSAGGNTSVGNLLDNIQVFLAPYTQLVGTATSGREDANTFFNVPLVTVVGNVQTAYTVNISVNTASSTAVLGTDYNTPSGTATFGITIPAGNYDGTCNTTGTANSSGTGPCSMFSAGITLIPNTVIQNNRTIVLSVVANPAIYTIASTTTCGGTATASINYTIIDDDVDLKTTKKASTAAPQAGVPFTYTVTYANNTAQPTIAPTTAHDVTAAISDTPPAGITFQSWTCQASNGAACPGGAVNGSTTGSGAISSTASGAGQVAGGAYLPAGNAAAGGLLTYTITAVANGTVCGAITNTSTIAVPSGFAQGTSVGSTFTSPATGGSADLTAQAVVDPICPSTLILNKETTGNAPSGGGPFNFTLSGTTQTTGTASTTTPNATVQVDGDTTTAGIQAFTIPPSAIGSNVTIQETALPANWSLQGATCTVAGNPVGSFAGSTYTLPSVAENTAYTCTFTNQALANVTLTKSGPATATRATNYQYTLTVTNGGVTPTAANVVVQDQLPGGVMATAVSGASCTNLNTAGALLTCTVAGPLGAGGSASFTLTVSAANAGAITNYAATNSTGNGSNPPSAPGASCNSPATTPPTSCANAPTTVSNAPNVSISKAFNPSPIISGGTSTLTITLANTQAGAVALTGLAFTDTFPAGMTVTSTPAGAQCGGSVTATNGNPGSVSLSGGSLAAGATCQIQVSVTAP